MKRLLLIIILTLSFQSWTKAEIAGEFEIQGLTLGDSLLKMYTEKEIKEYLSSNNSVNFYPSSKKYFTLTTFGKDKEFDQLNIDLKYNDTNYIIYGLSQYKRIKYKDCLNEQQTISENFENLFEKNTYQLDEYSNAHQGDPSGNSKYKSIDFFFDDGSIIRIICTDWGKEFEADNYSDNIDVGLSSKVFFDFLVNEAFK